MLVTFGSKGFSVSSPLVFGLLISFLHSPKAHPFGKLTAGQLSLPFGANRSDSPSPRLSRLITLHSLH